MIRVIKKYWNSPLTLGERAHFESTLICQYTRTWASFPPLDTSTDCTVITVGSYGQVCLSYSHKQQANMKFKRVKILDILICGTTSVFFNITRREGSHSLATVISDKKYGTWHILLKRDTVCQFTPRLEYQYTLAVSYTEYHSLPNCSMYVHLMTPWACENWDRRIKHYTNNRYIKYS